MTATIDMGAVRAVLHPLDQWAAQCHAASLKLVQSGVLGECRVARGGCKGVMGQHSWVVLGDDCYDEDATIIDPTLWSYDESVEGVWVGTMRDGKHVPHGKGSIFQWGRPETAEEVGEEPLDIEPPEGWSPMARLFLDMLPGPLGRKGWAQLAHAPVEGWPAGEIINAMCESDDVSFYVPIDIVGMVTDRNPSGLYLSETGDGERLGQHDE